MLKRPNNTYKLVKSSIKHLKTGLNKCCFGSAFENNLQLVIDKTVRNTEPNNIFLVYYAVGSHRNVYLCIGKEWCHCGAVCPHI